MIEIEVKGSTYRLGKLNAMQQFHVSRRMAPVFAIMGIRATALARAPQEEGGPGLLKFLDLLQPMSEVLSKMSDEDTNYVLHTCLGVVQRRDGERYQALIVSGQFMYEDIDMDVMLKIVIEVLRENLGGFLKGLGGDTPSPSP